MSKKALPEQISLLQIGGSAIYFNKKVHDINSIIDVPGNCLAVHIPYETCQFQGNPTIFSFVLNTKDSSAFTQIPVDTASQYMPTLRWKSLGQVHG